MYKSNSYISRPPIFKVKNRIFHHFLVEEVTFRQIEIYQKLISYFWECIENEILHLTNLYLNAECESRLSKPKEHRIARKEQDRA